MNYRNKSSMKHKNDMNTEYEDYVFYYVGLFGISDNVLESVFLS